jgi:hypothetical protein
MDALHTVPRFFGIVAGKPVLSEAISFRYFQGGGGDLNCHGLVGFFARSNKLCSVTGFDRSVTRFAVAREISVARTWLHCAEGAFRVARMSCGAGLRNHLQRCDIAQKAGVIHVQGAFVKCIVDSGKTRLAGAQEFIVKWVGRVIAKRSIAIGVVPVASVSVIVARMCGGNRSGLEIPVLPRR